MATTALRPSRDLELGVTPRLEAGLDADLRRVGQLAAPTREAGAASYAAFDAINARYFGGRLPTPLIVWALTAWGRCMGETQIGLERGASSVRQVDESRPPLIVLHPAVLWPAAERPWSTPAAWMGWRYAYDLLLHECLHVHIGYVLRERGKGTSSHDCEAWIAEVVRLAPLLGLPAFTPGLSRTKRVPVPGQTTKTGRPLTRVVRVTEGDVPRMAVAGFPLDTRKHFGLADAYYRQRERPWEAPVTSYSGSHEGAGR